MVLNEIKCESVTEGLKPKLTFLFYFLSTNWALHSQVFCLQCSIRCSTVLITLSSAFCSIKSRSSDLTFDLTSAFWWWLRGCGIIIIIIISSSSCSQHIVYSSQHYHHHHCHHHHHHHHHHNSRIQLLCKFKVCTDLFPLFNSLSLSPFWLIN